VRGLNNGRVRNTLLECGIKYKWKRLNIGREQIHLTVLDTMDAKIYQKKQKEERK